MPRFFVTKILFLISVIWGAAIFWLAPHPPMVDLPQHAGQISLLHDLAMGRSNWSDLVRVNLFTPYLLGYGLAFPFSFLFPVATSIKIVLSAAFICYVMAAMALRRRYGGDERLDWLFLLGFFGFAYNWGLFTFLVSAPIALLLILYCSKYAVDPTRRKGIAVFGIGFLLLASHGLAFVFACGVGGIIYLINARSVKGFLANLWPFLGLAIACGLYFIGSRMTEAELAAPYGAHVSWALGKHRLHETVLHAFGIAPRPVFIFAAAILLLAPWMLGLRPQWRNKSSWVMLVVVVLISFFVPNFALKTALLYQRFAVFFLPAYALAFAAGSVGRQDGLHGAAWNKTGRYIVVPLMILACWSVLGSYTVDARRFAKESEEIDAMIGRIEPGSRALALIFSAESDVIRNPTIYSNYASWYQAERKGFVDFNFAWFPPQIVRFRPGRASPVDINFVPTEFDWKKYDAGQYRYFIVRQSGEVNPGLFKGVACQPALVEAAGKWRIYERSSCTR